MSILYCGHLFLVNIAGKHRQWYMRFWQLACHIVIEAQKRYSTPLSIGSSPQPGRLVLHANLYNFPRRLRWPWHLTVRIQRYFLFITPCSPKFWDTWFSFQSLASLTNYMKHIGATCSFGQPPKLPHSRLSIQTKGSPFKWVFTSF